VVLRGVEVRVVGDLEGHRHTHLLTGDQIRREVAPLVGQQIGDAGPGIRPGRATLGQERVQHRGGEHLVAERGGQVEDELADRDPDPRRAVAVAERPVGHVRDAEAAGLR
jgi:hypothetical protein